jgi:alkylation response protein AidB-like acyl-CoA dehydrogenase
MNIAFTEEQEMLRKAARDFLVAECPKKLVKELEEDEKKGYSPEIWKKMADLGWQGMVIPEKYGGQGMSFQDFTILLEEMGRNILPGPFICTLIEGAYPLMDAGTEDQKKEFLPKIASGELICTMAQLEPNGLFDASGITLKATQKGDSYVLDGTKVFVEMANVANYILCMARTGKGPTEDGITVFLVDAKSPGIHIEVMPTIGMDKLCEVQFKNVSVRAENIIGKVGKGWAVVENVMRRGAIAKCAESIGGMQVVVDMTVAYSKERVQYDRPIGAFQALQHIMADMWTAMQTSRYIVYQAAWMESENLPCAREVAMAKAYVNEKYKWVTEKGVLLHGAIGTSREHDVPLYFRRAKAADIRYGGTDFQREIVANRIGLVS